MTEPSARAAAGDSGPSDPRERIGALDTLRGFALCGILPVNIWQTLHLADPPRWLTFWFEQRFFAIFSLLFGIGFAIFLERAATRTARPRLPLLRRLAVLAAFGGLHLLLQPGEVLLLYAACGLVFLLPAGYLPRRLVLPLGVVLLVIAVAFLVDTAWVPALFVIGLGLAYHRVPQTLPGRTGLLAVLTAALAALSVLLWLAGGKATVPLPLAMSAAYTTGLLLLLRTPLGRPVSAVLAPMGRMALTNYLMATVLFVSLGHLLGLPDSTRWGALVALWAGILVLQAVLGRLWLRAYRYGPLEWVWRSATWARRVPLRRAPAEPSSRGGVGAVVA